MYGLSDTVIVIFVQFAQAFIGHGRSSNNNCTSCGKIDNNIRARSYCCCCCCLPFLSLISNTQHAILFSFYLSKPHTVLIQYVQRATVASSGEKSRTANYTTKRIRVIKLLIMAVPFWSYMFHMSDVRINSVALQITGLARLACFGRSFLTVTSRIHFVEGDSVSAHTFQTLLLCRCSTCSI